MSIVQLTLRPPPHVDFVSGYPGIPPNGTDRLQAAVKGALEVRVPTQGVKAQWVKVELRKVETLPGGGAGNTFYDVVGPGTVTLWTSGGAEYEVLHARDFPFSIRIPEAVPPSLQLEQRAGIHYELVATVCTKGKRSFFRKRKHALSSSIASVIIDKHDLHATWPVYCQQETRHVTQDQINLTVGRNQSCYGPGDRMAVTATIKSEATHTSMLRSFEILLKETITFRGHMFVGGKKAEASTKTTVISENRFQVNTPMHGGMQATQDLFCMLSATHTNTTLTAARHIDITYVLMVKAHLGAGMPLVIELPVIISNWQRAVSLEAMRRIGPAPGLSLIPTPGPGGVNPLTQQPITRVEPIQNRPTTSGSVTARDPFGNGGRNPYNTYPTPAAGVTRVEDPNGTARRPTHQVTDSQTSMQSMRGAADEFGAWPKPAGSKPTVGTGKRPPSAASRSSHTHRFTITNALPLEIPQEPQPLQHQRKGSDANSGWLTAVEEKQRYEQAKARVEMVQGGVAPTQPAPSPPPVAAPVTPPPQQKPPSRGSPWPTAEEEKLRLFQNAQAAVARTQGYGAVPAAADPSSSKPPSAAAVMYSQAVSAMKSESTKQQRPASPAAAATSSRVQNSTPPPNKPHKVPGYLTAEEEKLALRRYEEAKKAVDLVQNTGYYEEPAGTSISGLVPYDSLYPSGPSGSAAQAVAPPPQANDLPPPFEPSPPLTAPQQLSEKERLRRAYEAQDAAALSRQTTASVTPSRVASPAQSTPSRQGSATVARTAPLQAMNSYDSSPPPFPGGSVYTSAAAEKEALRRRFEAQDAAATDDYQVVTPPQTPPRSTPAVASSSLRSRPAPLPPIAGASRVLTAAEEKALLKARYESQGAEPASSSGPPPPMYMNGYTNGQNSAGSSRAAPSLSPLSYATSSPSIGSPPPLMPRPPREYIKETQEEDARVARMTITGMPPIGDEFENGPRSDVVRALSAKPLPGNVVPPLPPKPVGE